MRSARFTLLLVLICQYTLAQLPQPLDRTLDRIQILDEIEVISKAFVGRDPGPFERIYLENYVSIRDRPSYNTREQLIAMMKADAILLRAGKKPDYNTISYETENPHIRFFGRSAIVTSTKKNFWQYRDQKCLTKTIATEIWVKPENDWKIAAGQVTSFQCDPKPYHPIHPAVALVPVRSRPPINTDTESEQHIREIINGLVQARGTANGSFKSILERYVADDFSAIDVSGDTIQDRSVLRSIAASSPSRQPGLRNQDDALIIYPDAAVYTFKLRPEPTDPTGEPPRQFSVFFARSDNRWLIVAAHTSKYSAE